MVSQDSSCSQPSSSGYPLISLQILLFSKGLAATSSLKVTSLEENHLSLRLSFPESSYIPALALLPPGFKSLPRTLKPELVQILPSSINCCVTSGKLLNLSEPRCPKQTSVSILSLAVFISQLFIKEDQFQALGGTGGESATTPSLAETVRLTRRSTTPGPES